MHRSLGPVSSDAVFSHLFFESEFPLERGTYSISDARVTVARYFSERVAPSDMLRFGCTTAHLALLGVDLSLLCSFYSFALLCETFAWTWDDMVMLNFDPRMLARRDLFPIASLVEIGLTPRAVASFPIDMGLLVHEVGLRGEDLLTIGFNRVQLKVLGLHVDDILALQLPGFMDPFGVTPLFVATLPEREAGARASVASTLTF